jgi:hypothetical protein
MFLRIVGPPTSPQGATTQNIISRGPVGACYSSLKQTVGSEHYQLPETDSPPWNSSSLKIHCYIHMPISKRTESLVTDF